MPDDRFFHKRLGHSEKISALTDFEFRVWTQYELSADDCGVMRHSAIALQADNLSLAKRPAKTVQRAFQRLVGVELIVSFEHQRQPYVCQLDWQDFQRVRFPRATIHPIPTPEVLAKCTRATQELFRKRYGETTEKLPDNSGEVSEELPHPTGAGGREWLTANGNGSGSEQTAKRAGDFVERYQDLHLKYRGVAYIGKPRADYEEALLLVQVHDDSTLDQLATVFLNADDDFARSGTATVGKFRSRATWCHERLNAEKKRRGIA